MGRTDKVMVIVRQTMNGEKTEKSVKVEGYAFVEVEDAVRGGLARLCGLVKDEEGS